MTRDQAGAIAYRHMGDQVSLAAVDAIMEAVALDRDAFIAERSEAVYAIVARRLTAIAPTATPE